MRAGSARLTHAPRHTWIARSVIKGHAALYQYQPLTTVCTAHVRLSPLA
jgi:predicted metal-binding membrane protein